MAGELAIGTAIIGAREVHDRQTAHRIAAYRQRLDHATDAEVLAAADRIEHLPQAHPLCAELRQIVDAELDARHLSLSPLAGGTR